MLLNFFRGPTFLVDYLTVLTISFLFDTIHDFFSTVMRFSPAVSPLLPYRSHTSSFRTCLSLTASSFTRLASTSLQISHKIRLHELIFSFTDFLTRYRARFLDPQLNRREKSRATDSRISCRATDETPQGADLRKKKNYDRLKIHIASVHSATHMFFFTTFCR